MWANETTRQAQSNPPWPPGTIVTDVVLAQCAALGWQQVADDYRLPRLLVETQKAAWEEIKKQRTERDKQPLDYLGAQFDFEKQEDREKIKWMIDAAKRAAEKSLPFSVAWTMADNSVVNLSGDQVQDIPLVVAMRSDTNHQKAREIKGRIETAQSVDDIDAILAEPGLWD